MRKICLIIGFGCLSMLSQLCWGRQPIAIVPATLQLGELSVELSALGEVTVSSPRFAREIEIEIPEGPITKIFSVRDQVVLLSARGPAYMLFMPLPKNYLSRRLVNFASTSILADYLKLGWLKNYQPNLVRLEYLKIENSVVHIHQAVFTERNGESDLLLKSMWETYSLRQLLQTIESDAKDSKQICASLLSHF